MAWTEPAILALTQDAQTLNEGRKLALTARWSATGASDDRVWGLCQGSGASPYRVCADDSAYKCSCPSRKTPCKHILGLLLLSILQPELFPPTDPPAWVKAWSDSRQKQSETAAAALEKPIDLDAQAKRVQAREEKVTAGMLELRRWLDDLVRRGLADERVKSYDFWDRMAARMVDAQASGVANILRGLAGVAVGGQADWATKLMDALAKLHLLIEAHTRMEGLPPEIQADVRQVIGWTIKEDEIKAQDGVRDHWYVLSNHIEAEDRLRVRRVWLYGLTTHHYALLLDFAFGTAEFAGRFPPAMVVDAEVVFYPSAYRQRALIKGWWGQPQYDQRPHLFGYPGIEPALTAYADALAHNVWLTRMPMLLQGVYVVRQGKNYTLVDQAGWALPVTLPFAFHEWWTAAVTGNHPLPVFGEWDGYTFVPRNFYFED